MKATKKLAKETDQQLIQFVEAISAMIWLTDSKSLVTYLNTAWLEFTGKDLDECLGYGWIESIHPGDLEGCLKTAEHSHERKEAYEIKYRLWNEESKTHHWINDSASPRYDKDANFLGFVHVCTDIQSEFEFIRSLSENEEKYRLLYNQTPVMQLSTEIDGVIIDASDFWLDKLGYRRREIVGRKATDFLTASSQRYYKKEVLPNLIEVGSCKDVNLEVLKKNGKVIDVLYSAIAVNDEEQSFEKFLCVYVDVTEKKRAEESLKQSEEKFRIAIESSPIGIALVSLEGKWLMVNSALCEIMGYTKDEFLELDFQTITHPDDLDADLGLVEKVLSKELRTYSMDKRYYRKNGSVMWAQLNVSLVENDDGESLYFISQIQDITERKNSERFFEEIYHITATATEDIAQTIEDILRITCNNLGMETAILSEIKDNNYYIDTSYSTHPLKKFPDKIALDKALYKSSSQGKQNLACHDTSAPNAPTHPCGKLLNISSYISIPIYVGGEAYGTVDFVSSKIRNKDFTISEKNILGLISEWLGAKISLKRYIEELRDSETQLSNSVTELTETNEELGRFAYVASHDLQEPLRMITSFTGLLQKEYGEALDESALEYVKIANISAKRMQELIHDLLDYAKMDGETGKAVEVNCLEILSYVKSILQEKISQTKAKITHDELPIISTNPVRLSRLLQNLLSNALKYISAKAPPIIHVGFEEGKDCWTFYVRDNGIGIDKKYSEMVFSPFKRLHRKDEYPGSGIGLAICQKIVDSLGGKIWIESKLGKGSTFFFTIPK